MCLILLRVTEAVHYLSCSGDIARPRAFSCSRLMVRLISIIVLLLFLVPDAGAQGRTIITTAELYNEDGKFTVEWQVGDESEVAKYVVKRKTANSNRFVTVEEVLPSRSGTYRVEDDGASIFKMETNDIVYRIEVYGRAETEPIQYREVSSVYASSTVRRTWGSIKAMFQ